LVMGMVRVVMVLAVNVVEIFVLLASVVVIVAAMDAIMLTCSHSIHVVVAFVLNLCECCWLFFFMATTMTLLLLLLLSFIK